MYVDFNILNDKASKPQSTTFLAFIDTFVFTQFVYETTRFFVKPLD